MALTSADAPGAEKPAPKPKAAPSPAATPESAPLARAGESGDPSVHHLLAVRDIALRNEDDEAVKSAEDALVALGFTV